MFPTLPSEVWLSSFFEHKLKKAVSLCREDVATSLQRLTMLTAGCPGFGPGLTEQDEQGLLQYMAVDNRQGNITPALEDLEQTLKISDALSKDLGLNLHDFLPIHNEACQTVRSMLTLCCTATCFKILHSKAARVGASSIGKHAAVTLKFAEEHALALPETLINRMRKLTVKKE